MFPDIFVRASYLLVVTSAFTVYENGPILDRQERQVSIGGSFGFNLSPNVGADATQADLLNVFCTGVNAETPECAQFFKDRLAKCRKIENINLKECEGVDLTEPAAASAPAPGVDCTKRKNRDKSGCAGRNLHCSKAKHSTKRECADAGIEVAINCNKRKNRDEPPCAGLNLHCNVKKHSTKPECLDAVPREGSTNGGGNRNINCNARKNRNKPECQQETSSGAEPSINCKARRNRNKAQCKNGGRGGQGGGGGGGGGGGRGRESPSGVNDCDKRKNRRKPECRNPDEVLNCKGKRKRKDPRCRSELMKHRRCQGKRRFKKYCLGTGEVSQAIEELTWLQNLTPDNMSVSLPNLPQTPSGSAVQSRFLLAHGQPDVPFYRCATPRARDPGHCRYLQHCILPEFLDDFGTFLEFVCFINGGFLGVCCPDSRYPEAPPPTTTTTQRPTTTTRPPTPATARGCGINSIEKDRQQTRIVGGARADYNEFPWAAALLRDGDSQYCGGVLISNRHILTASHCVDGFAKSSVKIRLGEYTFDNDTESRHQDFNVANIKMHEDYSTTTYVNDIAIITLAQATNVRDEIWPVCLPPPSDDFVGVIGTVIGWGTIYYGGPVSSILQKVSLPVWTNADCNAAYAANEIFEQNLCAGVSEGGKDSCQGDSGGPLLYKIPSSNRWVTIGVVSWGIRCAEPGNPGVYARVNKYLEWIDLNTN